MHSIDKCQTSLKSEPISSSFATKALARDDFGVVFHFLRCRPHYIPLALREQDSREPSVALFSTS